CGAEMKLWLGLPRDQPTQIAHALLHSWHQAQLTGSAEPADLMVGADRIGSWNFLVPNVRLFLAARVGLPRRELPRESADFLLSREKVRQMLMCPAIVSANWSSWTSRFEPPRINSLQSSSGNLINTSEGLPQAQSVLSRRNRPQVT